MSSRTYVESWWRELPPATAARWASLFQFARPDAASFRGRNASFFLPPPSPPT